MGSTRPGLLTAVQIGNVSRRVDVIPVGTRILLRDRKLGIVVAKRALPHRGGGYALPVKLAGDGRTMLIINPDELEPA